MDSITVKGYKSFKDITVSLKPINILIGSNGAGKSNFLSLFALMGNAYNGLLARSVALSGGVDKLFHKGRKVTDKITIEVREVSNSYGLDLMEADRSLIVEKEEHEYSVVPGKWTYRNIASMRGEMRRIVMLVWLVVAWVMAPSAEGQLIKRAGEMIQTAFDGGSREGRADSVAALAAGQAQDSVRLREMELQIQEMKLNEIMLRTELDNALNRNHLADSLKHDRQRHLVDSLRAVTPGVPVVIEEDTLFRLYAAMGGYSAADRADMVTEALMRIGKERRLSRDSVYTLDNDSYIDIMYGSKVLMSVTEQDALWQGTTPKELAELYAPLLARKITYLKDENSFWQIVRRATLFVLVLVGQYLIFRLVNYLFRRLRRQIIRFKQHHLKPLIIRDYELLNKKRLCRLLLFASNVVRILVLIIVLILTVPILFSIFPQTEDLALTIFSYILTPVKMVLKSVIEYIPNLFIIAVIWYCVRYIIKGLRYIAEEIHNERLKISGFYPDWARPTFNIIRFMLYAFMIAMIYPYLPGSQSGVFQGISVFVGLIVSLGSSTVISNFIAGFVITYMRPFRPGDFIKVKETVGHVIEKTPFVTRLRTIKNEVVTIPNSFIMSADTVNYSLSAQRYGLIIHTTMTMGYDTPWRKVHKLLIEAALATPGVLPHPRPFVLETELNDNYMCYQINAYVSDADHLPERTSDLLQNIQDYFHSAGIELIAPHYYATRDGNDSKLPPDFRPDMVEKPRSHRHPVRPEGDRP